MIAAAPRIDPRIRRVARRLSRKRSSIADIHRSAGIYAERLGLVRPSYEQIRIFVNEARLVEARRRATRGVLLDVSLQRRPVSVLEELLEE